MRLTFWGGINEVSGANYLLESDSGTKILIDCGLIQGSRFAEIRNFEPFPYDVHKINSVIVTHSHIDHIGRLPKLWKDGFCGKIYSTPPTKDFGELLLLDSEHILAEEARNLNKEPLYTIEDIVETMKIWQKIDYHNKFKIEDLEIEFFDAGHILGSSIIVIKNNKKTIVFSGDLGNWPAPIIKPTEKIEYADYLVIESTYGNKIHQKEKQEEELEDIIEDTVKNSGVLLIPSFAMERTQELLFHLNHLVEEGKIPRIPIFVDSPLAVKLTSVYSKYRRYFNEEVLEKIKSGDDILNFPGLHFTLTKEESKEINNISPPKLIIAGAGMMNGGRILHHARFYLSNPKNAILFVGYQSNGSLGRQILDGAKKVKIFNEEIEVRAKIFQIESYSAHADQKKLLEWVNPMRLSLKKLFVVQGEEEAEKILAQKIRDQLAVDAILPNYGESFIL